MLKNNQGSQKIGCGMEERIYQHIYGFWHAAGKNVVKHDYKDVFSFMRKHKMLVKQFETLSLKYRLFNILLFYRLFPDKALFGLLEIMRKMHFVK